MSESQTPVQDQRCQSGPSARNSFNPSEGRFSKNYGADQQRLQISDPHFDKFTTPATFACWKIRFKTEVCTCSQFPTEAMLWIKEVELVDSVDDLKSSSSKRCISMPKFEVLDARIASALNRIIHYTQFKRIVGLEEQKAQKRGPFPSRKTDRLLDLRILPGHWCQWFRRELCRPIYNCSSKWWSSGIRFKVGRNFQFYDENPAWWYLGRIVQIKNTRDRETQDRIGIVQYGDSSEESRTWWSQIEDNEKKYRAESTSQEFWGQKRKLWKERPGQESGNKTACTKNSWRFGNGKPTGSVWKETIAVSATISISVQNWHSRIRLRVLSCNRMREMPQEPEVPEAGVPVVECLDGPARIISKELAPIHSVKSGILQNAFSPSWRMDADLGKSALTHIDRLKNSRQKGPKKNGDKSAAAMLKKNEQNYRTMRPAVYDYSSNTRQLGCVFQGMEPPKSSSILRKSSDIRKPIRCVKFTKAVVLHADIRDQNPSLGMICPGEPHQRKPNAPKFEDRSQEEKEWQEQGAREAAWRLAKSILKFKEKNKAAFFSPSENRCLPASNLKPEEREFVVDSGASMHMISKKDLNSAEMDTPTKSCSPTTANGELQTHEEATVYVKELGIFFTMKVVENTPAVLSLGKLCDENVKEWEAFKVPSLFSAAE